MTTPVDTPPADQAAPATPAPPSPADMPATQPQAAAAPTADKNDDGDKPPSLEAKELARARKDAATYREKLRETEAAATALKTAQEQQQTETASLKDMLAKLSAVLNPDADAPPDPAKLAEQLTETQAQAELALAAKDEQIRSLTIRAALPTVASKAKAHPEGLLKVLTADGVLAKLDPTSETFAADLESAAVAAVEANPYLKVAPAATRSGAEIPGRSGGSDQLTREQIKGMKSEQIEKARQDGRLRTLLGG